MCKNLIELQKIHGIFTYIPDSINTERRAMASILGPDPYFTQEYRINHLSKISISQELFADMSREKINKACRVFSQDLKYKAWPDFILWYFLQNHRIYGPKKVLPLKSLSQGV
jgi:hypothetical protein